MEGSVNGVLIAGRSQGRKEECRRRAEEREGEGRSKQRTLAISACSSPSPPTPSRIACPTCATEQSERKRAVEPAVRGWRR